MSDSIFTKIINREIPAEIIWEDEDLIILMDAFPQVDGQILIIPKVQIDHFFDLEDKIYFKLFEKAKWISPKLKEVFGINRVILVIEGFEVPHVHIKLYPTDISLHKLKAPEKAEFEDLKNIANKLRESIML